MEDVSVCRDPAERFYYSRRHFMDLKPAYRYFTKTTSLLFERVDGANDYAVFRNGGSLLSNLMLKAYLLYHGNH
jgi:hypothetical protein